jgi:hypothetical protein
MDAMRKLLDKWRVRSERVKRLNAARYVGHTSKYLGTSYDDAILPDRRHGIEKPGEPQA